MQSKYTFWLRFQQLSNYVVKANTERKARLFAIKEAKKEHGDVSMFVVSCELIS